MMYAQPLGPAALPLSRVSTRWPPFSSWLLLMLVVAKPLSDALYEIEAVKYLYIVLLAGGAFLARVGHAFRGTPVDARNRYLAAYIFLTAGYFYYLFGLMLTYGGSLSGIFKIVSPFAFFVLVAFANDRWLIHALVLAAVLTIVVNAALLPFDFGWVQWGSVRTFKGYYYFKTDLAYALVFSLLIVAFYLKNRITSLLAFLMLLVAVQVVFANSRLNYLTLLCVLFFLAIKQGFKARLLLIYAALATAVGAIAFLMIDPSQLLGFDFSNMGSFSQGRNEIWAGLWAGMKQFALSDWLFGRGYFGDSALLADNSAAGTNIHNAHNELLYLVTTQGFVGLCVYAGLWFGMYHMCRAADAPPWARGTLAVAIVIFLFQGLTANTSPFATKTWPLVMVFLAVRATAVVGDKHARGAES